MRSKLSLFAALICLVGSLGAAPVRAQSESEPQVQPTPFNEEQAAEAAAQAGPPGGEEQGLGAGEGGPPPATATYRVFATQYEPTTPGSVEVAVPDKCAKFAARRDSGALRLLNCPASYDLGLDYRVRIRRDNGTTGIIRVNETGPWNIDDNYWNPPSSSRPRRLFTDLPTGLPEAQAAFYNGYRTVVGCNDLNGNPTTQTRGTDQFGRCVLNPAGIDLSVQAARQLGIGTLQNEWVTVSFLWEPRYAAVASVLHGQVMDVARNSLDWAAPIVQWPWHGGANQQWRFDPLGGDVYVIVSARSGLVLDVANNSLHDGAPIIQWPWHGGANQQWRLETQASGVTRIVSVRSGLALDVPGSSTEPGIGLIQWTPHGGANQQWRLRAL